MKKYIFLIMIVLFTSFVYSESSSSSINWLSKSQADSLYCKIGSCSGGNTSSSNTSEINQSFTDSRYVFKSGDNMNGGLNVAGAISATDTFLVGTPSAYAGRMGVDGGSFISIDTYNGTNFGGRDLLLRGNSVSIYSGSTPSKILTVNESGNVGIGTTSPGYKLDVSSVGIADARIQGTGTGGFAYLVLDRGASNRASQIEFTTTNVLDWVIGTAYYSGSANSKFSIGNGTNLLNSFLTIDTTGNVGIGTVSPTAKLDVNGSVNVTGNISAIVYHGQIDWVYTIIGMAGNTACDNLDNKITGWSYTCQTCIDTAGSTVACGTTLITLNANCGCKVD